MHVLISILLISLLTATAVGSIYFFNNDKPNGNKTEISEQNLQNGQPESSSSSTLNSQSDTSSASSSTKPKSSTTPKPTSLTFANPKPSASVKVSASPTAASSAQTSPNSSTTEPPPPPPPSSSQQTSSSGEGCSIYIDPNSSTLNVGQTFTLIIEVNCSVTNVNLVQANITYPEDNLQYLGQDSTGSSFTMEVPGTTNPGVLNITRGQPGVSIPAGTRKFTSLNFKAISAGDADVEFGSASLAINGSTDPNQNLLTSKTGAAITIH